MLDGDVAQTLGAILREELGVQSEILAIDGVVLWDFDYIDLGRIRLPSMTVPVTIKSLVFSEDPRLPRGQAHLHHHHVITSIITIILIAPIITHTITARRGAMWPLGVSTCYIANGSSRGMPPCAQRCSGPWAC